MKTADVVAGMKVLYNGDPSSLSRYSLGNSYVAEVLETGVGAQRILDCTGPRRHRRVAVIRALKHRINPCPFLPGR